VLLLLLLFDPEVCVNTAFPIPDIANNINNIKHRASKQQIK
jgi:hypothetical protein